MRSPFEELETLKASGEAPHFLTDEGYKTLTKGYLNPGETPKTMYQRVANGAAARLNRPDLANRFFDIIWKNWLCLATPVASNMNNSKGLPISCFSIHPGDNLHSILGKAHELGMMSKFGGGVGIYLGDLRGRGAEVKGTGGISDGVISWSKIYEATVNSVSQGFTRRGSAAVYLPIDHADIEDVLNMRRPTGDQNKRCLNIHHGVCLTDEFMESLSKGDPENRKMWEEILLARFETGEPYLFFSDNVNRQTPAWYKDKNLRVITSNICLAGDTLIATSEGPRLIKDLVDKEVSIWDGSAWVNNSRFRKTGSGELYRIYLSDGSFVDATDYHTWYVKPPELRDSEVPSYKPKTTKELVPGHKIQFHFQESHGKTKLKSAYAKGFLIAEGTTMHISRVSEERKPVLWVYKPKAMVLDRLKASLQETEPSLSVRSDSITDIDFTYNEKHEKYTCNGIGSRRELTSWCSDYKKNLPVEWIEWDRESKLEFLAGLFDGDGCYMKRGGGYQLVSIHRKFLLDIQSLLKTLGLKATISVMKEAGKIDFNDGYGSYETQESWRITISSCFSYKLSKMIKFSRLPEFQNKAPNRFCADFHRVIKVEKLDGIHDVYCTTVDSTRKFGLANGLMSGNCSEIFLHTDPEHSFVCCLSSLNLARWDEWKNTDTVELSIFFLDAVMEEFIQKAKHIPGFEASVRFAEKSRALGLGVLGWHSLLQESRIPFDSFDAMMLNAEIFRSIRTKAELATAKLAKEYGEPEWCKGHGRRNTHLMAIAPTVSNSLISGGLSAGIEPIAANLFVQNSAKGSFIRKNRHLEKFLEEKGLNTPEVWDQINKDAGSILNVNGLTSEEKEIFLTAKEINQFAIIRQAAQRQKWIDQGQSINLFFGINADPRYIHEVHLEAWKTGLKSLYYCRTESVLRADLATRQADECKACEG